jgi:hypothetical protein
MDKKYTAPEVKLAGDADDVVLGGGAAGFDFSAEDIWTEEEFLADGNGN